MRHVSPLSKDDAPLSPQWTGLTSSPHKVLAHPHHRSGRIVWRSLHFSTQVHPYHSIGCSPSFEHQRTLRTVVDPFLGVFPLYYAAHPDHSIGAVYDSDAHVRAVDTSSSVSLKVLALLIPASDSSPSVPHSIRFIS